MKDLYKDILRVSIKYIGCQAIWLAKTPTSMFLHQRSSLLGSRTQSEQLLANLALSLSPTYASMLKQVAWYSASQVAVAVRSTNI